MSNWLEEHLFVNHVLGGIFIFHFILLIVAFFAILLGLFLIMN